MTAKVEVKNVNHPGQIRRVDAAKYEAMKRAMLNVLPKQAPGMNQKEIASAVVSELPDELFPQGETAGWWAKTVQLDLEAKGMLTREQSQPLRWHRSISDR